MGRKPDGSQPRAEMIAFRIGESGLAKVDEHRGAWSRSEFIRQALAYAVKKGLKGPEPTQWK